MRKMFERFTDRARHVLALAQREAHALDHDFIGTEHLLLGLVLEADGVAGKVLAAEGITADGVREAIVRIVGRGRGPDDHNSSGNGAKKIDDAEALASIGIDLDEVRSAVEEAFGEGALDRAVAKPGFRKALGAPAFVPRMKKVIELSLREALGLGHNYIGTEHLLLAIIREGQGVAAQILSETIELRTLRTKVIDVLSGFRSGA
jgi:ATP-dependent Clp protease ATP-binding subunit ClpA